MFVIVAVLAIFLAGLGLLAFAVLAIVRLPTNYFTESESRLEKRVSLANKVLRNLLGVLIVTFGLIIMLPVFPLPPGSSVAIMVCGVAVMEFSGKKKILRRSAMVPGVLPKEVGTGQLASVTLVTCEAGLRGRRSYVTLEF